MEIFGFVIEDVNVIIVVVVIVVVVKQIGKDIFYPINGNKYFNSFLD